MLVVKNDRRRLANMNWTEIVGAIITAIVGPLLVLFVTRKFWSKEPVQEKEIEDVLTYGQVVAIRACDGKYVMTDLNDQEILAAHERHVEAWEVFKIVEVSSPFSHIPKKAVRYGDKVAFLAMNNRNFVGAALHSQGELTARVAHVKEWETFTLLCPPTSRSKKRRDALRYGSFFALQAYNGKNVMYNRDGDRRLLAKVPYVSDWETFTFIDPAHPQ
jgi:hypothetical protein